MLPAADVGWTQGFALILYTIHDWDAQFENNRSRTVEDLSWVAVPNRHDGENYTAIVTHKDGAEIYSAWNLIVQVASKCKPRGVLIRGNGTPHDAASLSLKTRAPKIWFEKAFKFLTETTDWLDFTEFTEVKTSTDTHLTPACQSGDEERKEGKDRKEGKNRIANLTFPDVLKTSDFKTSWLEWVKHRKEIRKPLTPTSVGQQLKMLAGLGEPGAIACIEYTIGKGWQGLAIPPNQNGTHQQNHSGGYQRLTGAQERKSHFGKVERAKPLSILLREQRQRNAGGGQPQLPLATPPPAT